MFATEPWRSANAMRRVSNCTKPFSPACRLSAVGAGFALVAVLALAPPALAQQGAPGDGANQAPRGLPPANWPGSPHHAVTDGWGRTIPCRCRFNGKAYRLGEIVCMRTHVGTVLTRCDIIENNTSWIPSSQPCEPDAGT